MNLRNERGMALLLALVAIMGLAGIVLAAAVTTVLEKNVTVTHRQSGAALYAADSGVETARQFITSFARDKLDSLTAVWNGGGLIIPEPATLFPQSGLGYGRTVEPSFASQTTFEFEDSTLEARSQVYTYRYRTTSTGQAHGAQRTVVSEGRLRVSASRGSFSDYLMFTHKHVIPGGSPIWFHTSGHFDGRVHTNDEFRFAYFPTFEDQVTSANQKAWYYNDGHNVELDAAKNGTIDVPEFYGGFSRGVDPIALPENSFSQQRAALGDNAADTQPLSNAQIRTLLGLSAGTTAPPDGVYVPSSGAGITGGIYVQGTAKGVSLSIDSSGNQVYKVDDSAGKTTTIVIERATNRTKVTRPTGVTTTYTGVPRGMLYVNGAVSSLKGPDRKNGAVVPAVTRDHQMSIVSTGDIIIQKDLAYQDYQSESVLGVFSSGGNVRIGASAPNELMVDAFVMASASGKVFTVDSYSSGSYRGQVHLRGGMVTNYYGAFGTFSGSTMTGYGRDFRYDRRGHVPPYYPLTMRFTADQPEPQVLAWRVEGD